MAELLLTTARIASATGVVHGRYLRRSPTGASQPIEAAGAKARA